MIVDLVIFVALALAVILAGEVFKAFATMRAAREMVEAEIRETGIPAPPPSRRGCDTNGARFRASGGKQPRVRSAAQRCGARGVPLPEPRAQRSLDGDAS